MDDQSKNTPVTNVPPEIQRAALQAKQDLERRDTTPTDPPLSDETRRRIEGQRVHTILVQKLDRLLQDHGCQQCPGCGHDQRFVHPVINFAGSPAEEVIPPFHPMPSLLMSTCCRCGLARYHALNAVLQAPVDPPAPDTSSR